jgi:hypothetical protein
MPQLQNVFRRAAITLGLIIGIASCGGDAPTAPGSVTPTTPTAGTYVATTLLVAVNGQPTTDVLAQGGALSLVIAADGGTSGSLVLPAAATGGAPVTVDMAGRAVQTATTVRFQQTADTFVGALSWRVNGSTLSVQNQSVGSAAYTIVLARQ